MPCRSFLWALGPVLLLAATTLAGEPLFDSQPGHPWDQVRDAFYVRRFSTGEVFEDPHAFEPPFHEYFPFTVDAAFHGKALALLESVEKLPPAQMEQQPAIRRLIFLRDLWSVFDGLEEVLNKWERLDKETHAKALTRRDELLRRLTRIMQRLELTEEEVRELPDAFDILGQKKLYSKTFDPSSPGEPFFPTDLLDKDGPWVTYSSELEPTAGGSSHMVFFRHRSYFTLHLRTPDGREGGERYLKEYTATDRRQIVPPGTMLALLRRPLVPTRSGKLVIAPLVESLQLIVATPPQDQRFKFTLDRKSLLAVPLGLKLLGRDDPIDHSNYESIIFWPHPVEPRKYDIDGETLVITKYKSLHELPRSLASCVKCHDDTTGSNIFGRSGPRKAYLQVAPQEAEAQVVKKKEASAEWKLYLRLRTAQEK